MKSRPLIVVLSIVCFGLLMAGCHSPLDQDFGTMEDINIGVVPPDMTSYRYDPEHALGATFARVLKENATVPSCASTNPEDFELRRINPVRTLDGCVAQVTEPNHKSEERIVRGGQDANISHLVGSAGLKTEYAFEFLVTTPLAASYPASQQCVNTELLVSMQTSPRTCEILFVTGATLTQVTYRQYTEASINAKYNALITVDGQVYGSTTFMRSYPILTVDFIALSNWFDRDEAGFVIPPTVAAAEQVVTTIQELPEAIFDREAALPALDAMILPELSIEFLLENPELILEAPIDLELVE